MKSTKKNYVVTIILALLSGAIYALSRINEDKLRNMVVVGDSISANRTDGWQQHVSNYLSWPIEKNLSKVGYRTEQMKLSLVQHLIANEAPDVIFIYGGVNDIFAGRTASSALKNIQDMVDTSLDHGVNRVYVVAGYDFTKINNAQNAARTLALQKSIEGKIKGAKVIPIWMGIKGKYSRDGIHLTNEGQREFSTHVIKSIRNAK